MILGVFRKLFFGIACLAATDWCLCNNAWGVEDQATLDANGEKVVVALSAGQPPPQELSLQQAFEMGLLNSRAVQRATFLPLQATEDYNKARTIYDPAIFLSGSADRTDRPTQYRTEQEGVDIYSALIEDRWQYQAGIKARLPTGATAALYQTGGRLESTSVNVYPDPQYQSQIVATLTQPLLKGIGDKEGNTSIEVANLNRQIAGSAYKLDVTEILYQISQYYWQLYFEQNVAKVTRESFNRAEDVYHREKVRAERGLSKPVDADRAQAAVDTRRANLLRAENQARLTARQLWLLLTPEKIFSPEGLPDLVIKDQPRFDVDAWARKELLAEALNQRQELAIARDTVVVSQQQDVLAAHNRLPQMDLKLNYGFNGLDTDQDGLEGDPYDDDYNNWRVELAFEWPLGGRSAAAEKRKTFYRLQQTRAEMRLAAEKITQELDVVLDEILLAEEELQVTKTAMEAAYRVMKGEEILFELGQKDNQDLLTVQDYYGGAQRDYLRAQARYNQNLVTLARVRGALLSDYGLNPEVLLQAARGEQ